MEGLTIQTGKVIHPPHRVGFEGRGLGSLGPGARRVRVFFRDRSEAGAPCRVINFATVLIANEKTT